MIKYIALAFSFFLLLNVQGQELKGPLDPKYIDDPSLQITAYINSIYEDQQGDLWVGTIGVGVAHYDGHSLIYHAPYNGFPAKEVRDILEDDNGVLWFATENGVISYDGQNFHRFGEKEGLLQLEVLCLAQAPSGVIWAGTDQGLFSFNGGSFSPLAESKALSVNDLLFDSKGGFWIAANQGLFQYESEALKPALETFLKETKGVTTLLLDKDNALWVGTKEGAYYGDAQQLTTIYFAPSNIGGTEVTDLYEDREGNVWIPQKGNGLFRFEPQMKGKDIILEDFFQDATCLSHAIRYCFQDQQGRMWLGGWTGLYRYDD